MPLETVTLFTNSDFLPQALARAVYADTPLLLLDDVGGGVVAEVGPAVRNPNPCPLARSGPYAKARPRHRLSIRQF